VVAGVNGDFFNMSTGKPSGALVMEGVPYHPANGRCFFAMLKDGTPFIGTGAEWAGIADNVQEAVGGSEVIVRDGEICTKKNANYKNSRASRTAVGITADETAYPDSARRYGVWEIPKLYLHLYGTDPITIDYDQPLTAFDGMTAFAVSQKIGFPSHRTQQLPKFVKWLYGEDRNITKASQIEKYNPCIFGLYHTTAGEDVAKNDFFENIISYAQQEQLELERLEQERLEQERLEKERLEKERQEQERLEKERLEQQRQEQERLEQERLEMERLEQLRLAQAAWRKRLILLCVAVGIAVITAVFLHRRFRCAG
jgi:hypothetical protein